MSNVNLQTQNPSYSQPVSDENGPSDESVSPAPERASSSGNYNSSAGGIARNALFSYGSTVVGALTGLIVTPLLLHHLGETQYGLWILLLSVAGYLGLLEIGLYMTVSKRVAECLALDDRPRLQQLLGTAFVLYALLGAGALVLSVVLAALVEHLFQLTEAAIPIARWCLFVLGINQFLVFMMRLQPALLFGAGRLDILTSVASITNLLASVLNVILALNGYSIIALAFCTAGTTILNALLIRQSIRRYLPHMVFHPRYANREMAWELLKFGSRNATLSIAGAVAFGADALVIGLLLPVSNVAHYAIASKLVNLLRELCQKPVDVLLPAYSHSHANRDTTRQFQMWSESISISMAICLPFVVAFWAFGNQIILAWVGPGHESSYLIGSVLGLMILLQLPGHASFMILTGTERNAFLVRLYIVSAISNLLLSVVLTRWLGPVGVALGSLLTVTVVDFAIMPWHVCREFEFSYKDYMAQSFRPLFPPLVASLVLSGIAKYFDWPQGTAPTLLMLGLVVLISWSAWGLWGINASRRDSYLRTARAAFAKFVPGTS